MTASTAQVKGILLAGGLGSRLYPLTLAISKQLLPVYDKPMIYYPLSVLMLAGIRDILLICMSRDLPLFRGLLGDGSQWGITLSYAIQDVPAGVPQAFTIGADFIGDQRCVLILGDNLFFGEAIGAMVAQVAASDAGAAAFCTRVRDPQRYGVVTFGRDGKVRSLEEKPKRPRSDWAVTGLYSFPAGVAERAAALAPSARGEVEIVDLMRTYLQEGRFQAVKLGRGYAWLDAGTHDSLLDASEFVRTIELRQGLKVACLEEIALQRGFVDMDQFLALAQASPDNAYGAYLRAVGAEASEA